MTEIDTSIDTAAIAPSSVENLPVSKLTVDHTVQRSSVDGGRVEKIVRNFRPEALGVLAVSDRGDGTMHVIDGGHRRAALLALGLDDFHVRAEVYCGLTEAQEAELFTWKNNTRGLNPVDRFRVAVKANDPTAVTLDDLLTKYGWEVAATKSKGKFTAVGSLQKIYGSKYNGPEDTEWICERVIRILTEAWGHDTFGVAGWLISGLGAVLLRYPTLVDDTKMVGVLADYPGGPRVLVGHARGLRDFRSGSLTEAMAEKLVNLFNKNRPVHRLPAWRSAA